MGVKNIVGELQVNGSKVITEDTLPIFIVNEGSKGLAYTLNENGTYSVTGVGTCTDTDIVIPSICNGNKVTGISSQAFYECTSLTSVVIPDSVTSIGDDAFYECTSLTSVVIPDSVASIGDDAFYYTAYYNNKNSWVDSVLYIGNHLIKAKKDTISGEYVIKDGTVTIADRAFGWCDSLTSVVIPDSITTIGSMAFYICSSLESVVIPDSVTSIGGNAFYKCNSLTSVVIGDSVTSIGDSAFRECGNLTSVTIGNSVTSIDDYAFHGCKSLASVEIPDSVTSIGRWVFSGCSSLTSIIIPDSVTSIGGGAFSDGTNLTTATIPTLAISRMPRKSLTTAVIISGTSLSDNAFFDYPNLTSVVIGDSVASIGDGAFKDCSNLTSVTIPDSVTYIGNGAFSGCSNLKSVTIPDSVTSIVAWAFSGCTNLTIYAGATEQPEGWSVNWNPDNRPVVWGVDLDFAGVNDKIVNHETRITELENNSSGGSGSGGGASIIYATEKPSTPQQAIYVITEDEVVKVDFYQSQTLPPEMAYCEIVDTLPEIKNAGIDLVTEAMYAYYLTTDDEIYGYVDAALEAAGGVPVGWYPVAPLFDAIGITYGGKITSADQVTDASTMYALVTTEPKTRVYVPMPDGTFLELTSGIRTRFDEYNGTVSITEV